MTAVPFRVYLAMEPGRARPELVGMVREPPEDPSGYPAWAREVLRLCTVAGMSRWVRRRWERLAVARDEDLVGRSFEALHVDAVRACYATGAAILGYNRRQVDAAFDELADDEAPDGWVHLEPRNCARSAPPDEPPAGWWASLEAAVRGCRADVLLTESDATGQQFVKERTCGSRGCLACARSALARSIDRYIPAFAVPMNADHGCEMYTLGSTAWIDSRSGYTTWRKALARIVRAMVEGLPSCGIPPRSWQGGLVVAETTGEGPKGTRVRGAGRFFAHAHLLIIRAGRYPYGLSDAAWRDAFEACGVDLADRYTPTGRTRKSAVLACDDYLRRSRPCQQCGQVGCSDGCPADPMAWLGLREVQRRAGVGEVGKHQSLSASDDGSGLGRVSAYLKKVHAYLKKAHKSGADSKMYTDRMCQWALKGTRRVQPFGCLTRMHAGPSLTGREVQRGQRDPRRLLGVFLDRFEAITKGARPEPDDWPRFVEHRLNGARVETWREWGDVDAFLEKVARDARPSPATLRNVGWASPPPPVPEPWRLLDDDTRAVSDDRFWFLAHRRDGDRYNLPDPTVEGDVLASLGDIWNEGEFGSRCADPKDAPPPDDWRQADLLAARGAA